jgi:hypothetical protein
LANIAALAFLVIGFAVIIQVCVVFVCSLLLFIIYFSGNLSMCNSPPKLQCIQIHSRFCFI